MDDATLVGEVRTALDAGHLPAAASADRNMPSGGETAEPNSPRAGSNPPGAGSNPLGAGSNPPGVGSNPSSAVSSTPIAGSNTQGAERTTAPAQSTAPGWTGATGRPTRFLLLRHGQTELSVQRRYSGRGNPPLTELGREQAARVAKMLAAKGNVAAVVTSPLGRARETAEAAAAALGVPVHVIDGLIETDFGDWEGLTFQEAAQRDPQLHAGWLGDPSVPAPGGESFDQVRERVEAARRDLVALYPGANLVVVSHVTPIKTLLQLALGVGPSLLYRLHLDLASLSIAEFYPDGGSSVRLVNDTSYL
jgi:probable phosphoglycerate mutase